MKAIRLRHPAGYDNLRLEAIDPVEPGPGEVQVRVRAASLNFRDMLVAKGFFPTFDGIIPLSDGAGEVVAVGEGVPEGEGGLAVGDAVVSTFHPKWRDGHVERGELDNAPGGPADGFAAEIVTRPAASFTRAPANLSHAEAATLTCAGVTAWRAVITDGAVRPGATVLVLGTGGVSLFALQFAKLAGATVIATSSSADKCDRLRRLGADHVINYRETPQWADAVRDIAGGVGVDHVIEVGGPHTIGQSFAAARTAGHIAVIGAAGGFDIDTMPFAIVQAKRLRLQAVTVGSRADQLAMVRAIEAHGLKPVLDREFALAEIADAFRHLESGRHIGKVTLAI
ncbi:MAG: NAD(P)-dependent alcohol dehydrogenase [Sphingomonadales bacterium]|nr:NAD(P)-dependent alcohol dehydrogenase [Sphingomonadales bacterium]